MLALLLPLFVVAVASEDGCREVTVDDCPISKELILSNHSVPAPLCESLCKVSEHCRFWRVHQNGSMELPECLLLGENYQQVKQLDDPKVVRFFVPDL